MFWILLILEYKVCIRFLYVSVTFFNWKEFTCRQVLISVKTTKKDPEQVKGKARGSFDFCGAILGLIEEDPLCSLVLTLAVGTKL